MLLRQPFVLLLRLRCTVDSAWQMRLHVLPAGSRAASVAGVFTWCRCSRTGLGTRAYGGNAKHAQTDATEMR